MEQVNKRSIKVKKIVESTEVSTPNNSDSNVPAAAAEPVLEQVYLVELVWTKKFLD